MDVVPYMPGDPMLIDRIVCELKSQGIFDSFRKECIADVDTKPAYQNLRQRVEGSVSGFLRKQKWSPEMNKNQVREMLRKNIYESGFLETGVERIVDQVVNPKMNTVFLPKVTEVVYKYLGIEKPTDAKDNLNVTAENLLPKDLEAVSPESDKKDEKRDNSQNLDETKMEEDESPPFEPIDDNILQEENSIDSHLSGFSGLISHDSNQSDSQKPLQIDTESQISKHSTDAQSSFATEEQKMEISEDSNSKTFEIETSSSNSTKIEKKKEDKKDEKREEKRDDKKEEKRDDKKEEKRDDKKEEKRDDKKDDKKKDRHRSSDKKDDRRDRKDSKTSSKDRDKSKDKKDISKRSSDKYKSSSSSKYSSSSSTRDKGSSSRSKDKNDSKDRSKDKKDSKHDDKSKSSSHSKSDRHRKSSSSSTHHSRDKKDKKHSKDDHYSSKHKSSSDRRSTDRDSNDGSGLKSSSSSYCESNSSSQTSTTQTSKTQDSTSNSNDSGNSDSVETKHATTLTIASQEIHLGNTEFKLIKPKIASNIHEARKIIKIRKQLKQIEQQSSIALNAINQKIQSEIEMRKEEEIAIISPPRISVSMASWDALEAKMNENINFDSYCEPEEKPEEKVQLVKAIDDFICFTTELIIDDEIALKKIEECINSCLGDIKFLQAKMELNICNNIISNQKEDKENKRVGIKRKLSDCDTFKKIKNNNNLIGVNANEEKFSLPLSPAESDASGDRKVDSEIESPVESKIKRRNSKRYSSDDLYKPRPLITRSSRRRGTKLD